MERYSNSILHGFTPLPNGTVRIYSEPQTIHCKKDFPVPSRDVTNQTLPGQGEFGYFHTGWGQENRQPFLQCIRTAIEYGVAKVTSWHHNINSVGSSDSSWKKQLKVVNDYLFELGIIFGNSLNAWLRPLNRREKIFSLYRVCPTV
jgi:hypothetical protein